MSPFINKLTLVYCVWEFWIESCSLSDTNYHDGKLSSLKSDSKNKKCKGIP